ncbi:hypothetical protein NKH77_36145 [Streptomyces sp. M19]
MKRNLVIATVAAAALIGGGTATAVAFSGSGSGDGRGAARTSAAGTATPGSSTPDASTPGTAAADRDDDARDEDTRTTTGAGRRRRAGPCREGDALRRRGRRPQGGARHGVLRRDRRRQRRKATWDVDVLGEDGRWHDLTLDADTAKVLDRHVDRDEEDGATGALRGPVPTPSRRPAPPRPGER